MCTCSFLCMFLCMCAYICVNVYVLVLYVHMCMHMYVYKYMCMHIHIYIYTYTYTYAYPCTCTCSYTYTYFIYMYTWQTFKSNDLCARACQDAAGNPCPHHVVADNLEHLSNPDHCSINMTEIAGPSNKRAMPANLCLNFK